MKLVRLAGAVCVGLLCVTGSDSAAQVFVDLPALTLSYRILFNKDSTEIGTAEVSFTPVGTGKEGRLNVVSHERYALPGGSGSSAVTIDETVKLHCDKKGVESFEVDLKTGDTSRHHEAVRKGIDYVVTSMFGTKSSEKTITAGVQHTITGMYSANFFGRKLRDGPMFEDFPLLFPNVADHRPGQLVREGAFPMGFPNGEVVLAYSLWVKRLDKKTDRFWFSDDANQVLLRKELATDRGTLVYEIVSMNGEPYPPKAEN